MYVCVSASVCVCVCIQQGQPCCKCSSFLLLLPRSFLKMAAAFKRRIGFKGTLLLEPKPQEPTKHQYDWDVATTTGVGWGRCDPANITEILKPLTICNLFLLILYFVLHIYITCTYTHHHILAIPCVHPTAACLVLTCPQASCASTTWWQTLRST